MCSEGVDIGHDGSWLDFRNREKQEPTNTNMKPVHKIVETPYAVFAPLRRLRYSTPHTLWYWDSHEKKELCHETQKKHIKRMSTGHKMHTAQPTPRKKCLHPNHISVAKRSAPHSEGLLITRAHHHAPARRLPPPHAHKPPAAAAAVATSSGALLLLADAAVASDAITACAIKG
jgi:hypothetical protein